MLLQHIQMCIYIWCSNKDNKIVSSVQFHNYKTFKCIVEVLSVVNWIPSWSEYWVSVYVLIIVEYKQQQYIEFFQYIFHI